MESEDDLFEENQQLRKLVETKKEFLALKVLYNRIQQFFTGNTKSFPQLSSAQVKQTVALFGGTKTDTAEWKAHFENELAQSLSISKAYQQTLKDVKGMVKVLRYVRQDVEDLPDTQEMSDSQIGKLRIGFKPLSANKCSEFIQFKRFFIKTYSQAPAEIDNLDTRISKLNELKTDLSWQPDPSSDCRSRRRTERPSSKSMRKSKKLQPSLSAQLLKPASQEYGMMTDHSANRVTDVTKREQVNDELTQLRRENDDLLTQICKVQAEKCDYQNKFSTLEEEFEKSKEQLKVALASEIRKSSMKSQQMLHYSQK